MNRTSLPTRLQDLITRIPYVTIATADATGQPWNTPVVGRFDAGMNLYWVSWKQSQHSQNIALNPHIFVVVYDSTVPEGSGEGLYLQMRACALDTQQAIRQAQQIYDTSFFEHTAAHAQFLGGCPQRIYKAIPERIWHNIDAQKQDIL